MAVILAETVLYACNTRRSDSGPGAQRQRMDQSYKGRFEIRSRFPGAAGISSGLMLFSVEKAAQCTGVHSCTLIALSGFQYNLGSLSGLSGPVPNCKLGLKLESRELFMDSGVFESILHISLSKGPSMHTAPRNL